MFTSHYLSHVRCPLSRVRCHLSRVRRVFFGQSGGASRWRVCYQRGLPRLVLYILIFLPHCDAPPFLLLLLFSPQDKGRDPDSPQGKHLLCSVPARDFRPAGDRGKFIGRGRGSEGGSGWRVGEWRFLKRLLPSLAGLLCW